MGIDYVSRKIELLLLLRLALALQMLFVSMESGRG